MSDINLTLTERELATAISSLLFSCSINVVSNTTSDFQAELFQLAKKLKELVPQVQLEDVQFVKEEDYEEEISVDLYKTFKDNIKIVSFENV